MGKTLAYRLFRAGRFPSPLTAQLESEGILVQDEGIAGSVTYSNFHRPRSSSAWRRQWYTASLALTQTRLVGLANSSPIIDVPFSDERFRRLGVSLEKTDALLIAFDASLFHSDWSGNIEYRLHTPQAQAFLDALKARAN